MNRRPRTMVHGLALGLAVAVVVTAANPPGAAAHDPIGWVRRYATDNRVLTWKWGGAYPRWVTGPVFDTLENGWSDPVTNNSRLPSFELTSTGAGRVFYSASMTSPCSGANIWLACAMGGGTAGWEIHVRNLDGAPHGSWAWYDKTGSCAAGATCFRLQRSMIHEPIHLTFGTQHSSQTQLDTVFTANQPSYGNTGGSTTLLRRCDQAAAQLAYDLRDMGGPYGDCFDHIANGTSSGLETELTVRSSNISVCQGVAATVSGRLHVRAYSSYKLLGANPLKGRVVRFDLDDSPNVASTTATDTADPADNWSKSFSNASYGSRTYTAHFDRSAASGLASSPRRSFTITWLPAKLC